MPNISGTVLFSSSRTVNSINTLTPISSVAVTLYNESTKIGATILSTSIGNFEFTNVPIGDYLLVESAGASITSQSPSNFLEATTISTPIAKDPLVSSVTITNLPSGANTLDSLTPNTLKISINSSDLLNQHFVDGPVIYSPITILNTISTGDNLITLADNGIFGTNMPSTPVNTSPSTNPYQGLATGFGYQKYSNGTPNDGNISIVNIETLNTFGTWWNLVDHTTGDERGNFLVVNGANPGASIFSQKIQVKPLTYYAFSAWIANQIKVSGEVDPQFLLNITGENGSQSELIFSQKSNIIQVSTIVPSWKQIGKIFNSENYSNIVIDFISDGIAANGNDYAVDDVLLKEVIIDSNIIQTSKSVKNKTNLDDKNATVGDLLIYSISIINTSTINNIVNMVITDTLSNGLNFIQNSVLGGTLVSSSNNVVYISTETIPPSTSKIISFEASISNSITIPAVTNQAKLNYGIEIAPDLGPAPGTLFTNIVTTSIDTANLYSTKTVSPQTITTSGTVTYTVDISNQGTVSTNKVLFTDTLPNGLMFNQGSLVINNNTISQITLVNGAIVTTIPNITPKSTAQVKFSAIVNQTIPSTIINSATIFYSYGDSIVSTTLSSSASTSLNVVTNPTIPQGKVSLSKASSSQIINPYQTLTYTVTISNSQNNNLNNVIFYDTLPCNMEYEHNSFLVNGINYGIYCLNNGVNIGTIVANSTISVSFDAKLVCVSNDTIINNKACILYKNDLSHGSTTLSCSNISSVKVSNCDHNYAHICCEQEVYPKCVSNSDMVTYTVEVFNNGNVCANNVLFSDMIPSSMNFIDGSLSINGKTACNIEPSNGILSVALGCMQPHECSRIKYDTMLSTIVASEIINTCTVSYNYINCYSLSDTMTTSCQSSLNVVTIPTSNISIDKYAVYNTMELYDSNTYIIEICNYGTSNLNNVIFYDTIPSQMIYKPYSFTINNINYNIEDIKNGVLIGIIPANCTIKIKFKVKAVSVEESNIANNIAYITYNLPNSTTILNTSSNLSSVIITPQDCNDNYKHKRNQKCKQRYRCNK